MAFGASDHQRSLVFQFGKIEGWRGRTSRFRVCTTRATGYGVSNYDLGLLPSFRDFIIGGNCYGRIGIVGGSFLAGGGFMPSLVRSDVQDIGTPWSFACLWHGVFTFPVCQPSCKVLSNFARVCVAHLHLSLGHLTACVCGASPLATYVHVRIPCTPPATYHLSLCVTWSVAASRGVVIHVPTSYRSYDVDTLY